jgi:UDP-glucose 4-epimerase
MRYLVTGGAGFIGSNTVDEIVRRGHSAVVLDDFSAGREENLKRSAGKIEIIRGSITDLPTVQKACEGADYVIHLAALTSVPRSVKDPLETNHVNIDGTLNVLVAARDAKVRRLVYAASCSAYGEAPIQPQCERMSPDPISPYGVTKFVGELYAKVFYRCYGLETICLRYFNVFGPRENPTSSYSGVLSKFVTALLIHEQPIIFGDGEQSRDFTYVENVVLANLLATKTQRPLGGAIINIACGRRVTINELAVAMAKLLGRPELTPVYEPARAGDVKDSLADLSAARSILGYEPIVAFREGLERTVRWYSDALR